MQLVLQIILILVASLLGIVTNYATNVDDSPWLLKAIQHASVPAIGVLISAMGHRPSRRVPPGEPVPAPDRLPT
ncbi:hypothetical protein ACH4L7_10440 [Streptomyces anulatus]